MSKKLIFTILVFLCLIIVFFVFQHISKPQLVAWDEAGYILYGYHAHQALKKGDWLGFLRFSKSQFYYPFFQSWYLGFATLPAMFSINNARLVSALLLLPTAFLIWLIGEKLSKENRLVAILSVCLVLTSPLILYYYSTAMKESLGLVLTLACLWFYFLGREKKRQMWLFIGGLLCLILTLTKYNYGVLVLMVLVIESLLWFVLEKSLRSKNYWLSQIAFYVPVIAGLTYWLFFPTNNLRWFWEILQNKFQVNLYETTVLGHLLYYPAELAFSYSFSWLAFVLLVIGFIWGLKDWRNCKIRILALLFLVNFVLAEKHMANNQARFIFTSVPAFFLIGSFGLTHLVKKVKKLIVRPLCLGLVIPFFLAAGAVLVKDLLILPKMIRPTVSHQVESAVFYEQDFQDIRRFEFSRSSWPKIPSKVGTQKVEDVFEFIFENVDLSKKINLVGHLNEFSPDLFRFNLAKAREKETFRLPSDQYQEYFVTVEVELGGRFDTPDFRRANFWILSWVKQTLNDPRLVLVKQKTFSDLGMKISILGGV